MTEEGFSLSISWLALRRLYRFREPAGIGLGCDGLAYQYSVAVPPPRPQLCHGPLGQESESCNGRKGVSHFPSDFRLNILCTVYRLLQQSLQAGGSSHFRGLGQPRASPKRCGKVPLTERPTEDPDADLAERPEGRGHYPRSLAEIHKGQAEILPSPEGTSTSFSGTPEHRQNQRLRNHSGPSPRSAAGKGTGSLGGLLLAGGRGLSQAAARFLQQKAVFTGAEHPG